jgi:hypothetical protein
VRKDNNFKSLPNNNYNMPFECIAVTFDYNNFITYSIGKIPYAKHSGFANKGGKNWGS